MVFAIDSSLLQLLASVLRSFRRAILRLVGTTGNGGGGS